MSSQPPSALDRLDLPPAEGAAVRSAANQFPDGGEYRVEIPSVEGPEAFDEVVKAAAERGVRVHRISQGSGITLLTDAEIVAMVALGAEHRIEVCLFTGPRAAWDIGAQARTASGAVVGASVRGSAQLLYALRDVERACELGVRSVLLGDLGLIWAVAQLRTAGDLPADLVIKSSVSLPVANPATGRVLQELGVNSLNLPVDLALDQIASMRAATQVPLDIYIEGPDDFGAPVRHHELPDIVRLAAPVYLKFAVRNSPGIYPSGEQLRSLVLASARERVRRASIGLALLERHRPNAVMSP